MLSLRRTWPAGLLGLLLVGCASAGSGADGGVGTTDAPLGSADAGTADATSSSPDATSSSPDATSSSPDATSSSPDAMPSSPDAMPSSPDAMPGSPDAGILTSTLSQTTVDTITAANSVACVGGTPTTNGPNRYFRVYDLSATAITGDFEVTQVSFGVESATSGSGSQPATVLIHTVSGAGAPTLASLTQVGSQAVTIADQNLTLLDVGITATVPAGSRFAVELSIPDGTAAVNLFFFGSNGGGESAPAYIVAGDCGINEFTDADSLNSGNSMHLLMNVTGTHAP